MTEAPPGFLRLAGHPLRWRRFGYVVTLCDRVREVCPEFPGHPEAIHWSIPDPAGEPDGYQAFRRVAAELRTRIGFLLARIAGDGE